MSSSVWRVRAMLTQPVLVFADEPTSRLDLATQARTMDILMSELADTGCALLLVTHDQDLAAATIQHLVEVGGDGISVVRGRSTP